MVKKDTFSEFSEIFGKEEDKADTTQPEPAFSPFFWIFLAVFFIFIVLSLFWDYIEDIGVSAFLSSGIFILFIFLNILSALKRKKNQ